MTTAPDEDSSVEQALTGGALQRVGWYRFYFADERWEWSEEVEQIHGYQPGPVTPTTELVLSHKHPDDYPHIAATLDDIRRTHKPFSTRHRIITVQGDVRDVVVIRERFHDNTGEIVGGGVERAGERMVVDDVDTVGCRDPLDDATHLQRVHDLRIRLAEPVCKCALPHRD